MLGQALLAKKVGRTRLIAETGAGQHGVASATAAALMDMERVVFMGPHPFPTRVRDFQAVISNEINQQMLEVEVAHTVSDIPCAVCLSTDDAPQFWDTAALVDGVIEEAPIVALCGRYGKAALRHVGAHTRRVIQQLHAIP